LRTLGLTIAPLLLLASPFLSGQVQFTVGSSARQVRVEGLTENVGNVIITAHTAGTLRAGSTITITYNTSVTGAIGPKAVLGVMGNTLCFAPCGNAGVTASGTQLTLSFPADLQFGVNDYLTVSEVRLDVNHLGVAVPTVTATLAATSPSTIFPITFSNNNIVVANIVDPSLTLSFVPATAAITTCQVATQSFSVVVKERASASLTTLSDENKLTPDFPVTNGTAIVVDISDVPAGLAVTPGTPVYSGVNRLTVPAAQTSSSQFAALTFVYTVTADDTTTAETYTLPFTLGLPAGTSGTSIGAIGTAVNVAATAVVGPQQSSNVAVAFNSNTEPSPTPVATVMDCPTSISVQPTSLTFSAAQGQTAPAQTLAVTTSAAWTATATTSLGGNWLSITPQTGTGSANLTVTAATGTLAAGTYSASIKVAANGGANPFQLIPVTFTVTASPQAVVVTPSSLTFTTTAGQSAATQQLTFSLASGVSFNLGWTSTVSSTGNWLSLSPTSGSVASTTVTASTASLPAGTYSGSIVLNFSGAATSSLTVPVTLTVNAPTPTAVVTPSSLIFTTTAGQSPATQQLALSLASGSAFNLAWTSTVTSTGGTWLSISPASGTGAAIVATAAAASLPAGTYSGSIVIHFTVAATSLTVPVTLTVNAVSTAFTAKPSSLTFTTTAGQSLANQQLTLSLNSGAAFNVPWAAVASSTGNWLSVNPSSGSGSTITVMAATSSLATGSFSGSITITTTDSQLNSVTVPVTLTVTAAPIAASPTPLRLAATAANPGPTEIVNVTVGSSTATWTAMTQTTTGGNWLSISQTSGTGNQPITVSGNAVSLSAGIYGGSIVFTRTDGTGTATVPVTLVMGIQTAGADQTLKYPLVSTGTCSSSFFIATAQPVTQQDEGVLALVVSINQGLLVGGFNLGGGFAANGGSPGFGQFKMPTNLPPASVNIQLNAQNIVGETGALNLVMAVNQVTATGTALIQTTNGPPPLNLVTPLLMPGNFYTVTVTSAFGSARGKFQLQLISPNSGFEGGVVAGGVAIQGVTDYGGFCLPSSQVVSVQVQEKTTFGATGAGNLTIGMQDSSGKEYPNQP